MLHEICIEVVSTLSHPLNQNLIKKFQREYRDCIKGMETRPGCRIHAIIVTSCHGNDDEAWSTSCLIMQHKPYIVELSFMETQKSHDLINEGPSLTMKGPPQTNVVHVPMSHLGQNLCLISNYNLLPIPVICLVALYSYTNLHTFV